MPIDFGRTAAEYAAYRAEYPKELFSRLRAMRVGQRGQRVLDLGTGTGALARGFARAGCSVRGLDPSTALLDQARQLDGSAQTSITYVVGRAEDTGLEAGAWMW